MDARHQSGKGFDPAGRDGFLLLRGNEIRAAAAVIDDLGFVSADQLDQIAQMVPPHAGEPLGRQDNGMGVRLPQPRKAFPQSLGSAFGDGPEYFRVVIVAW